MRVLGILMILTLLLTGFSAATQAFGDIMKCPNGMIMTTMKDCCDHAAKTAQKAPAKNSCAHCDFCCFTAAVLIPQMLSLPTPPRALPALANLSPAPRVAHYPAFRPPASFALI